MGAKKVALPFSSTGAFNIWYGISNINATLEGHHIVNIVIPRNRQGRMLTLPRLLGDHRLDCLRSYSECLFWEILGANELNTPTIAPNMPMRMKRWNRCGLPTAANGSPELLFLLRNAASASAFAQKLRRDETNPSCQRRKARLHQTSTAQCLARLVALSWSTQGRCSEIFSTHTTRFAFGQGCDCSSYVK